MEFLRRNTNFGTQPEFAAVGKLRARVDKDRRGIDFVEESSGSLRVGLAVVLVWMAGMMGLEWRLGR